MIDEKLEPGTMVCVDDKPYNGVKVISQTPKRLFTRVQAENGYIWELMTGRLKIHQPKN